MQWSAPYESKDNEKSKDGEDLKGAHYSLMCWSAAFPCGCFAASVWQGQFFCPALISIWCDERIFHILLFEYYAEENVAAVKQEVLLHLVFGRLSLLSRARFLCDNQALRPIHAHLCKSIRCSSVFDHLCCTEYLPLCSLHLEFVAGDVQGLGTFSFAAGNFSK